MRSATEALLAYNPAEHRMQPVAPVTLLAYCPCMHSLHGLPAPIPACAILPLGQFLHVKVYGLLPICIFPSGQLRHSTDPINEVRPLGHIKQSIDPDIFEYVFASQLTHSVLPTMFLTLPGMQGRHAADALTDWYLPDGQSKPCILF